MAARRRTVRFTGEHGLLWRYRDYECDGWTVSILVRSPSGVKLTSAQARAEAALQLSQARRLRGHR